MNKEKVWLEKHSEARRGRELTYQYRLRMAARIASFIRHVFLIVSAISATLVVVCAIVNWQRPDLIFEVFIAFAGIAVLCFGGFLIERIILHSGGKN